MTCNGYPQPMQFIERDGVDRAGFSVGKNDRLSEQLASAFSRACRITDASIFAVGMRSSVPARGAMAAQAVYWRLSWTSRGQTAAGSWRQLLSGGLRL